MNRPNRSVYRRRIVGRSSRWDSDYFDGNACSCVVSWEGEDHARRLSHPTTDIRPRSSFQYPSFVFRGKGVTTVCTLRVHLLNLITGMY